MGHRSKEPRPLYRMGRLVPDLYGKVLLLLVSVFLLPQLAFAQSDYTLESPDGTIEVRVRIGDDVRYDVSLRGKALLKNSSFSLNIDRKNFGRNQKVIRVERQEHDGVLEPIIRQKFARIRENYRELRLEMDGGFTVVFRAYNEGIAYRMETALPQAQVKVYEEKADFKFEGDHTVFYPQEESFFSHNERRYVPLPMSVISTASIATLPAVVDFGDGVHVAIAESDLEDYPGMWLVGTGSLALEATFPPYPLKEQLEKDRDFKVVESADYIAVTRGTRSYPWRVLGIVQRDGDLLTNELVWLLEKPSQFQDTSWIRPGKVAWDWWNALNLYGVDFRAGINTQTYKYYIDFAADHGLEYVILDEGWYKLGNLLQVVPEIDMDELISYAHQKHVGVILWVIWKTLDDQLEPALDQFAKWGISGIKVDFMQRSDQILINYYHKICREAAKRKLLVDFHGDQKPATMTRTWPNLINVEGVRGLEWDKWSAETDPDHDATLPFTRMFLGPMDYTPGAMLNATKKDFAVVFDRPMSQGTRCHQLAMYVIFDAPLQMLSDSPSNYLREPKILDFLSSVPTTWDETTILDGLIGQYVISARRNGRDWYVGAMTNWAPRDVEVSFRFLPKGTFHLQCFQDGINADRMASDYKAVEMTVDQSTKINVHLAPGGGWAAKIIR